MLACAREIAVWGGLKHPNILPLIGYHISLSANEAWLISPYAPNGNIYTYLEDKRPDAAERVQLAQDTLKGLEYLHTREPPICHGDIKALNVLVNERGRALLCDFGLARNLEARAGEGSVTTTCFGGTTRYLSPESIEKGIQYTAESDIWSWGCLALEILTGHMPFDNVSAPGTVVVHIQKGELPADVYNVECPEHIRQLLLGCWERKPDDRPSATACLTKLNDEKSTSLAALDNLRIRRAALTFGDGDTQIGAGGFGSVHLATIEGWLHSETVAVKKLQTFGDKRRCVRVAIALMRELTVWKDLWHENVVELTGFFLSPDLNDAWLVSPYYKDGNIKEYLARTNAAPFVRLVLVMDIAEGLAYLHTRDPPVCHGDVKPHNVLINSEGRALLCDFGLARSMEGTPTGMTTSTFHQCGSLAYQSPELLMGTSLRSPESDIWAWGCLILTDAPPYKDTPCLGVLVRLILTGVPPSTPASGAWSMKIQEILTRCWSYEPSERPTMVCNLKALRACEFERMWTVQPDSLRKVKDICLSKDGTLLAITFENRLDLYDAQKGCTFPSHSSGLLPSNGFNDMCFSHDTAFLATGHKDGVLVTNLRTFETTYQFKGHTCDVWCLAFAPNESYIASGSLDGTIRFWYLGSNPTPSTDMLPIHLWASILSISSDSQLLAAVTRAGIHVWDVSSKTCLAALNDSMHWVSDLSFTFDRRTLAILRGGHVNEEQIALVTFDTGALGTSEEIDGKWRRERSQWRGLVVGSEATRNATMEMPGPHSSIVASYSTPDDALQVTELDSGVSFTLARDIQARKAPTSSIMTTTREELERELVDSVCVKKLYLLRDEGLFHRKVLACAREITVWGGLKHLNILPLLGYHISLENNEVWLASPHASSGNISAYLRRRRPDAAERIELALDTLKGLEYLHTRESPICHGDIKALNVLVNDRGRAQLCDFGLARNLEATPHEGSAATTGFGGTTRYLSPESVEESIQYTLESDVWAWGCLALEIFTGLAPYHDVPAVGTVIVRIQRGDPPADVHNIDCPEHIRQLLLSCWERRPGDRLSATACLTKLNAFSGLIAGGLSLWEIPEMVESYLRDLKTSLDPLDHLRIARYALTFKDEDTQIGVGGFGSVHRATMGDTFDSRVVAVKKLQTFGDKRHCVRVGIALARELTVWETLNHPNIIQLIGFHMGSNLEDAWLISPYYKDGNIKEYLARTNVTSLTRLALLIDVAEGLSYLHARDPPVSHGDIKPV
ncbi:hypothetical protein FRB99_002660 [Tulasnella sp. 403]|nr:hypothetical protein FRB99_002660 [Tulasnella sp. 403]